MSETVKKAQMSPENKAMLAKYLKMGVGSAVLSAGIGAAIRRNRANKERAEANDANKDKNAIIVPIKKDKFIEGLPTPAELAKSRGETARKPSEKKVESSVADIASSSSSADMTPEQIAAKKKEILRGRKIDFFKGAQAKAEDSKKEDDGDAKNKEPIVNQDAPKGNEGNRILPPRNEMGQFTSPADPVAVKEPEKDAEFDWLESGKNFVLHPLKTLGGAWDSATARPMYMTAGGITSLFLASMIIDKVNEVRAKRAKADADNARDAYVKLLQEKDAQEKGYRDTENPISMAGTILGGSFIIPMALSSIIANKIMEKRKADKAKKKNMSDSYPDEPLIIYKTSEAKQIEISPETALVLFLVKRAMIETAEGIGMSKSAAWGGDWIFRDVKNTLSDFAGKAKNTVSGFGNAAKLLPALSWKDGRLTDESYSTLAGEDYDENVFGLVNGWLNNDEKVMPIPGVGDKMKAITRDPRTLDLLVNKFENSNGKFYNERWGKLRDDMIYKELSKTFGDRGIGGMFKNVLAWLAKNTGIGNWMFRRGLRDKLGTKPVEQQPAGNVAQGNGPTPTPNPAAQTA